MIQVEQVKQQTTNKQTTNNKQTNKQTNTKIIIWFCFSLQKQFIILFLLHIDNCSFINEKNTLFYGGQVYVPGEIQLKNSLWMYRSVPSINALNSIPSRSTDGTSNLIIQGLNFGRVASDIVVTLSGKFINTNCTNVNLRPSTDPTRVNSTYRFHFKIK